jgi:putative transposase
VTRYGFKRQRMLTPIGNIPSAEAEERYYAMLDEQKMAA